MAQGSTCSNCGFHSEQLLVSCPRCREAMQHDHCKSCGRCPGKKEPSEKKQSN